MQTQIGVFCNQIAALSADSRGRYLLQLTPASDFEPADGRWTPDGGYKINAEIAGRVIAQFNAAQPLVIDYEHQTLYKEQNGQHAPAAGWIYALKWIEGKGLFAEAELTKRALDYIEGGEYRYFSPVLNYNPDTGEITQIIMGAVTNTPAIHGMRPMNDAEYILAASARFNQPHKEQDMKLKEALMQALNLENADDDAIVGAVKTALTAKAEAEAALEEAKSEVTALSAKQPDPAKFVPVAAVQELQEQVAALSAQNHAREVEDLIAPALADGRLAPTLEEWARELGKSNKAALSQFLETAKPIAALTARQSESGAQEQNDAQKLAEDARMAYLNRISKGA